MPDCLNDHCVSGAARLMANKVEYGIATASSSHYTLRTSGESKICRSNRTRTPTKYAHQMDEMKERSAPGREGTTASARLDLMVFSCDMPGHAKSEVVFTYDVSSALPSV